jgi:hypothetical protein
MSSIVSRLSRAAVVRRWIVEAGSKKNHPELIALASAIASKDLSYGAELMALAGFDEVPSTKDVVDVLTKTGG